MSDNLLSRSLASIEETREKFEGKEDYESIRFRLQKKGPRTSLHSQEVDRFLHMMREKGGGSITLAWRRYFDSDGDGELSFIEFCKALVALQYEGDVPGLWRELGGTDSNAIGLEALDPENAAILDTFSRWCITTMGGPMEVFRAIDRDMSDSLTAAQFCQGLRELGFFHCQFLPQSLISEELVLANLYPLLVQSSHGCMTLDQLLFLEKDKEKRESLLVRTREHSGEGAPAPLRKDAERLLHNLSMKTTLLGGKHWKLLRDGVFPSFPDHSPSLARHCSAPCAAPSRRIRSTGKAATFSGARTVSGITLPVRGEQHVLPGSRHSDPQAHQSLQRRSVGQHGLHARDELARRDLTRSASSSAVVALLALDGGSATRRAQSSLTGENAAAGDS